MLHNDDHFSNTPAAQARLHLDNCGSALMTAQTITAMQDYFSLECQVGGYVAEERMQDRLSAIYPLLADIFGGGADDYAITGSAVDAWTKGFYSVPLEPGDVILTSYNDYCSNVAAYLHRKDRDGIDLRVVPSQPDGQVDMGAFRAALDDRVKLISVTHMACSSGQILPAQEIGTLAQDIGAFYCLDACQTAGHVPLDVSKIQCDILSATSRKFLRGPRGAGFLYLSRRMRENQSPLIRTNNSGVWEKPTQFDWRQDAQQFETWEKSAMLRVGFASALEQYRDLGPEKVWQTLRQKAATLRAHLRGIKGVTMTCPPDAEGAIIGFYLDSIPSQQVKAALEAQDIAVQVADAVHTRFDFDARNLPMIVRASPHIYTRDEDIARFCACIDQLVTRGINSGV